METLNRLFTGLDMLQELLTSGRTLKSKEAEGQEGLLGVPTANLGCLLCP